MLKVQLLGLVLNTFLLRWSLEVPFSLFLALLGLVLLGTFSQVQ